MIKDTHYRKLSYVKVLKSTKTGAGSMGSLCIGLMFGVATWIAPAPLTMSEASAGCNPSNEMFTTLTGIATMATTGMGIGGAPMFVEREKRRRYIQAYAMSLLNDVALGGGDTLDGLGVLYGLDDAQRRVFATSLRPKHKVISSLLVTVSEGESARGVEEMLAAIAKTAQRERGQ